MKSMTELEQYTWHRFTLTERAVRYGGYLVTALLISWSLRTVDIFWPWVWDAPAQMSDLASRMFPPNTSNLTVIAKGMVETLHIAVIATAAAVFMAFPVALISAKNITPHPIFYWIGRFIIVATRSIDTLIWALLFVAILGPGPVTGIIAVAFRSIGFLGKLVSEAIEEIDWGPVEAVQAAGAGYFKVLIYAVVPQIFPAFLAITVLRWEINIRESTVLGLVGAGGIGFLLQTAIDIFAWRTVSTILIAIIIIVVIGETVSAHVRKKIL